MDVKIIESLGRASLFSNEVQDGEKLRNEKKKIMLSL
jgi:hypothetical protein